VGVFPRVRRQGWRRTRTFSLTRGKKEFKQNSEVKGKEVVTRRVKTETLLLLEFVFLRASPPPGEILFSASKRLTTVRANAFGFTLHNFEFAGAVDCVHFMGRRYVIL
jgi:hypothetical protein